MMNPRITEQLAAQHRDDLMREARQARLAHEATAGSESSSRRALRSLAGRLLALVRRTPANVEAAPTAARPVAPVIPR